MKLNSRGSTLVEVLIAVALAVVVVVAMISLGVTSQRNANFSKNQVIATNLSKQGVEIARSIRDEQSRVESITQCSLNNTWDKLWADKVINLCGGTKFKVTASGGLWVLEKNTTPETLYSIFKRQVEITDDVNFASLKTVKVTTTWEDSTGSHQSELINTLSRGED